MKIFTLITVFLSFLVAVRSYTESEYDGLIQSAFDDVKKQSGGAVTDNTNLTTWDVKPVGSNFNCELYDNPGPATTVHELTPYDIKIVGGLGDSVTAAMGAGASNIIEDLIEYRELSWTIGGFKDLSQATTIPNIIEKYNPNVRGYSTKGWLPFNRKANNNVAQTGAIAQDIPDQARKLVDKIKSETTAKDFEENWKLVSLWIGGNNLCSYCKKPQKHSVENYIGSIREALDYLQDNLPRTFVNIIQIIDVTRLAPLDKYGTLACRLVHGLVCTCIFDDDDLDETSKASTRYQEAVDELIGSQRYDVKDDFTVVIQPFFEGVELPYNEDGKPDQSYFAPDCFHFSTKGHKETTTALWNNMIEPVGGKTSGWELGGDIHCPTKESPYFYTAKNSRKSSLSSLQSAPADQPDTTVDNNNDNHQGHNIVATALGSFFGVAFFVLVVAIVVVIVILEVGRRQLRNRQNSERLPLVARSS